MVVWVELDGVLRQFANSDPDDITPFVDYLIERVELAERGAVQAESELDKIEKTQP